jgi:SAM-dependent methyltransferase
MSKILATAKLEPNSLIGKEILDAGCGTGEKSCYFSFYGAKVTSIDLCNSSLEKAGKLAEKFNLRVEFCRCDILDLGIEKRFDHIFCLGVLHHTGDPYARFRVLAEHCKPGGTITIGLYHRYGRFLHRVQRLWIKFRAGDDIEKRRTYVERKIFGRKFRNTHEMAYAADKYVNPYESYHTLGEIMDWFRRNKIDFIGSYPATSTGLPVSSLTQFKWLFQRKGFFIISGRKN